MVVPWIAYSIWKNWVIHVLVFLVFHVFSTAELISPCKTVNLAVWAFSSIFLHDFTLFGIDMNYIYHISSIATTFGPLSKVTILGQKCMAILGIRQQMTTNANRCQQTPSDTDRCCLSMSGGVCWRILSSVDILTSLEMSGGCLGDVCVVSGGYLSGIHGN